MIIEEDDYLEHYGTPRHSGRYPWGSGGNEAGPNPHKRSMDHLDYVAEMRSKGLTDTQIAEGLGIKTPQLRARTTIAKNAIRNAQIIRAQQLNAKGMSDEAAAREMGLPASTYRTLLKPGAADTNNVLTQTAAMLKQQVAEKGMIDVGSGVETHVKVGDGVTSRLGISQEKLRAATELLKEEGYSVHQVPHPQQSGNNTHMKVLVGPGVTQRDAFLNRDKIQQIQAFSPDGGRHYGSIHDPISVDPNRIKVNYAEDGGDKADGVLYVRPGVKDVSLGNANYAQVRVLVNGTHYMKGMAMYRDDLPPGTDIVFNTKKSKHDPNVRTKLDVMKPVTGDKDYPFGTIVNQITENTGKPDERVTSSMNVIYEEGDWHKWSKTLSSQMLSKQTPSLAQRQLGITFERRRKELDEINKLTNPTVKKKFLQDFASNTDKAAENQKAAAIKGSAWHAILPLQSLKPNEVYAPNYENGTQVALIRHPHGGTFEIPNLVVNNRNPEGRNLLSQARDAVGIHPAVASHLSGADFDGDTVLVIPNNSRRIKFTPALESLKKFDPIHEYAVHEGDPPPINTQLEMGKISNLITDMTLKLAPPEQIARAVKHSMVVIDAEKHGLDWKASERNNGILALKAEYQGKSTAGAATLISRRESMVRQPQTKPRLASLGGPINPVTGAKEFQPTNRTRKNKDGERVPVIEKKRKVELTSDLHTLSSGTPMERVYAEHGNKLKRLANEARLSLLNTPRLKRSPSAAKVYEREVSSLNAKLNLVKSNRPRERAAQVVANAAVRAKFQANPNLDEKSKKRIRSSELNKARNRMGASQEKIKVTNDEWNAIQAGAVSENVLSQILNKADMTIIRKHATPRREVLMTPTQTSRAKALLNTGATRAEVARILGVSLTTLDNATHSAMELERM